MSLSETIAPHLPFLRRFSRAVSGSHHSGDALVAAMLTDGHKAALSAMAVSRDEPNLFEQFLVLCDEAGLLSEEDCDQLGDAYVEARRARAA